MKKTLISERVAIKGYKVTGADMKCQGFKFELNKKFTHEGKVEMCNSGFHYCPVASDCFSYKPFNSTNRVFEIIDHGETTIGNDKNVTGCIELTRELTWIEVLSIVNFGKNNTGLKNTGDRNTGDRNTGNSNTGNSNTGNSNTGNSNTGDRNTGYRNAGYRNTGDSNTGYRNAGDSNTGDSNTGYRNAGDSNTGYRNTGDSNTGNRNAGNRNTGDWNTGNRNTGDWNTGNWNTGNRNTGDSNTGNSNTGNSNTGNSNTGNSNTGDRNTGNSNTGDRNTGDWNTGYRNAGAFCTDNNPKLILFDVQTDILVKDWENHKACILMNNLNPNIWIWESEMSETEKTKFPSYKTSGGFLKSIPMHEAWTNFWGNLSDNDKHIFTSLPHFSKEKFKEITGIDV